MWGALLALVFVCKSHISINNKKNKDIYNNYISWRDGSKKIILKASITQLHMLLQEYKCFPIYDAGKTQIQPNSLTCVGFYPSNNNQEKFKHFKLL